MGTKQAEKTKTARVISSRGAKFDTSKRVAATQTAVGKAQGVFTYSPEVEARRAAYERLGESLAHMAELDLSRSPRLDFPNDFDRDEHRLMDSIDAHLRGLMNAIDWFNPVTIMKFYAEMRLHADQIRLSAGDGAAAETVEDEPRISVNHQARVTRAAIEELLAHPDCLPSTRDAVGEAICDINDNYVS